MTALDAIVVKVIQREGGVAQLSGESWVTRWGQTPNWLATFHLPVPLTPDDAADNYVRWMHATKLDQILAEQYDVLADVVIDFSVHSGHVAAIQALQKAVKVKADGVIGPVTLEAIRIDGDRQRAAARIIADRSKFQGWLIARNPAKYSRFAHGWANRQAEFIVALVP